MPCSHEASVFQSAIENSGTAYQAESDAADALIASVQALVDAQATSDQAHVTMEAASVAADSAQTTEAAAYDAWAECRRNDQTEEDLPAQLPAAQTATRINHREVMKRLQDIQTSKGS